MTDTNYLRNLLKYASKIEALCDCTRISHVKCQKQNFRMSNWYVCSHCEFQIWHTQYDHVDTKWMSAKHQIDKIKSECFMHDEKSQKLCDTQHNRLISLPECVMDKISSFCDHVDLINLMDAYPHLTDMLTNPIYWSNLKIHFSEHMFDEQEIFYIFKYLNKNLKHVTFISMKELTNEKLETILDFVPNLKSLKLGTISDFNGNTIKIVTDKLKQLEHFSLESNNYDDDCLFKLLDAKHLNSIELGFSESVTAKGVFRFVTNIKNLVNVNVENSLHITDKVVQEICLSHSNNLEVLIMDGECQTFAAFEYIDLCKNLKVLKATNYSLSGKPVEFIRKLTGLESLTLRCTDLTSDNFERLFTQAELSKIFSLDLSFNQGLDNRSLTLFGICFPNLQALNISDIGSDYGSYLDLENILKHCRHLKSLDVSQSACRLCISGIFQSVPEIYLQRIKYLNIAGCLIENSVDMTNEFVSKIIDKYPYIRLGHSCKGITQKNVM